MWGRVPKTKPHLCTSTPGIQRPSLSGPEKGREIFLGHGGWEGQENFSQRLCQPDTTVIIWLTSWLAWLGESERERKTGGLSPSRFAWPFLLRLRKGDIADRSRAQLCLGQPSHPQQAQSPKGKPTSSRSSDGKVMPARRSQLLNGSQYLSGSPGHSPDFVSGRGAFWTTACSLAHH